MPLSKNINWGEIRTLVSSMPLGLQRYPVQKHQQFFSPHLFLLDCCPSWMALWSSVLDGTFWSSVLDGTLVVRLGWHFGRPSWMALFGRPSWMAFLVVRLGWHTLVIHLE